MLRTIVGVIIGYLIFSLSAVALFKIAGVDPHSKASTGFMVFTIAYGIVFAFLGGYVATAIAKSRSLVVAIIVTVLIATGALVSLLAQPGPGAIWTQVSALILMAPAATVGGWLKLR
ncbi:MAG TPA: hypothetical protein VFC63_28340 [Blastocatellia bacterium]|nr:hypothetical protein [Blastocatellia bacterium]